MLGCIMFGYIMLGCFMFGYIIAYIESFIVCALGSDRSCIYV